MEAYPTPMAVSFPPESPSPDVPGVPPRDGPVKPRHRELADQSTAGHTTTVGPNNTMAAQTTMSLSSERRSIEWRCKASDALQELLIGYRKNARPIDVSFRDLVGPIPVNELSHSVYPYPARLLRQIPRFVLNCDQLNTPGDVVLDPFCGSGTVLIEACAAGLTGWGIDSNPFARLLSRVKTTRLKDGSAMAAARQVLNRAKTLRAGMEPNVVHIDLWYSPRVCRTLARLRRAIIDAQLPMELHEYLLVCLAICADKCSLRDPRIPVPVRRRNWREVEAQQDCTTVWSSFEAIARSVSQQLSTLPQQGCYVPVVEGEDAAQAGEIFREKLVRRINRPRLIVTSPPYGAAQKYIRSSSLALGWTGLATADELSMLERKLIGREHLWRSELTALNTPDPAIAIEIAHFLTRNPRRAAIYAEYFRAMDNAIANVAELLSPGGFLVLVAGSNTVAGRSIQTHRHLRDMAIRHGLVPILELRDTIRGRVLLTKRASAGAPIHYETVHVLHKVAK